MEKGKDNSYKIIEKSEYIKKLAASTVNEIQEQSKTGEKIINMSEDMFKIIDENNKIVSEMNDILSK